MKVAITNEVSLPRFYLFMFVFLGAFCVIQVSTINSNGHARNLARHPFVPQYYVLYSPINLNPYFDWFNIRSNSFDLLNKQHLFAYDQSQILQPPINYPTKMKIVNPPFAPLQQIPLFTRIQHPISFIPHPIQVLERIPLTHFHPFQHYSLHNLPLSPADNAFLFSYIQTEIPQPLQNPLDTKKDSTPFNPVHRQAGPTRFSNFALNIRNFGGGTSKPTTQYQCGLLTLPAFRNEDTSSLSGFGVVRKAGARNGSVLLTSLQFDGPNLTQTAFNKYRGYSRIFSTKITYGVQTRNLEAPWQVAMFVNGRFHCGASIISNRHILTAAHCVTSFRTRPERLKLSLGDWDLETTADGVNIEAKVKKVIPHADFSFFNLQNDIAILELEKTITFSDRIRPICLPPGNLSIEGERITVTGWGRNEDNLLQKKLHKLTAVALENSLCSNRWVKTGAPSTLIGNTTVCMDTQYGDSCKGDSGGPAIMEHPTGSKRFVLAGIVSFGSGSCTDANLPGVYTRVTSFKKWITDHMKS